MTDSKNNTLEIDTDLKVRLAALASRSGQSFAELAQDILRTHADEQERTIIEYAEDEQRWQRYLETGKTIPFEKIRSKLQGLSAEAAHHRDIP
jgi:predicted transcriptional regulator